MEARTCTRNPLSWAAAWWARFMRSEAVMLLLSSGLPKVARLARTGPTPVFSKCPGP